MGALVTDKEDMRRMIKEFLEEIGGVGEVFGVREGCVILERKDADEMNKRISREEVEKCVRGQKNGKAAEPDEIPYEMCQNGGEVVTDRMTELFNQVWEEERVPRMWNECRLTLLHEGGYKSRKS